MLKQKFKIKMKVISGCINREKQITNQFRSIFRFLGQRNVCHADEKTLKETIIFILFCLLHKEYYDDIKITKKEILFAILKQLFFK